MKAGNLLPFHLKHLGWLILLPAIILGIMVMYFEFEIPDFSISAPFFDFLGNSSNRNNLTNELVSIIAIVALGLIAFTEEEEENEWMSKIRLESLQWSVYCNYILLILAILFIYNMHFFEALVYNMFTIPVLFILLFNYVLRVKFNLNQMESHEK